MNVAIWVDRSAAIISAHHGQVLQIEFTAKNAANFILIKSTGMLSDWYSSATTATAATSTPTSTASATASAPTATTISADWFARERFTATRTMRQPIV